jgi:hypothetical protein
MLGAQRGALCGHRVAHGVPTPRELALGDDQRGRRLTKRDWTAHRPRAALAATPTSPAVSAPKPAPRRATGAA